MSVTVAYFADLIVGL